MTNDSFKNKTRLTLENIEKIAPETPGAIILYDKKGTINKLIIAEGSIKSELLTAFSKNGSSYFSFRETNVGLNVNSIIYI